MFRNPLLLTALLLTVAVSVWGLADPQGLASFARDTVQVALYSRGWFIMLTVSLLLIVSLWLAFSGYGRIKLGIASDQPEFSTFSWLAMMFAAGIIFFSFFYTAIMFDPKDVADNLKRQGAYVPGIRPGQQTAKYIDDVITRLTVFGAIYVALVCLLPEFMVVAFDITFQLGGTALLIVVVVAMDFMSQVQSHLMSSQYAKLMEKSNLQGYGRKRGG